MKMKSCKECGKPVAASAETCPHCGAFRYRRTSPVVKLMAWLLGAPLLAAIAFGIWHST